MNRFEFLSDLDPIYPNVTIGLFGVFAFVALWNGQVRIRARIKRRNKLRNLTVLRRPMERTQRGVPPVDTVVPLPSSIVRAPQCRQAPQLDSAATPPTSHTGELAELLREIAAKPPRTNYGDPFKFQPPTRTKIDATVIPLDVKPDDQVDLDQFSLPAWL